jgi:hypothetical protein
VEAVACSLSIIAKTTAGAVTTGLVSRSLHHIGTGGALDKGAIRATATDVAHTPHMHLRVPRDVVVIGSGSLVRKSLLSEAHTSITAFIGAHGTLASNSLVIGKANALTILPIANTLVGTLNGGMGVVCLYYLTNPSSSPIDIKQAHTKGNRGGKVRHHVFRTTINGEEKVEITPTLHHNAVILT